jgi:hypothetical protein
MSRSGFSAFSKGSGGCFLALFSAPSSFCFSGGGCATIISGAWEGDGGTNICACCLSRDHQPSAPAIAPKAAPPITNIASESIGAACLLLFTSSCVYNHQIQRSAGINQRKPTTISGTDSNQPLPILSSKATVSIVPAIGGMSFLIVRDYTARLSLTIQSRKKLAQSLPRLRGHEDGIRKRESFRQGWNPRSSPGPQDDSREKSRRGNSASANARTQAGVPVLREKDAALKGQRYKNFFWGGRSTRHRAIVWPIARRWKNLPGRYVFTSGAGREYAEI